MRITALRSEDEAFVQDACRSFLDEHIALWCEAYGLDWSAEVREAHVRAVLSRDVGRIWLAASHHDRNIVAVLRDGEQAKGAIWGEMNVHPFLGIHVGVVAWIWVDPALRGQGHGGRLVAQVKDWAAMQGCHHVDLNVIADNEAAVNLYVKQGFRTVDHRMVARLG